MPPKTLCRKSGSEKGAEIWAVRYDGKPALLADWTVTRTTEYAYAGFGLWLVTVGWRGPIDRFYSRFDHPARTV